MRKNNFETESFSLCKWRRVRVVKRNGGEGRRKGSGKNCWPLDPLKIPHALHFLCLPPPLLPSSWLFEFALALLSVISAVLTFWFEPVTSWVGGHDLFSRFSTSIVIIPLGLIVYLALGMRIDLILPFLLDRRVNENFYNLFFESGARNFRILLWGLCILPIPFFNWMGKINAHYCYYYLIAGIIKIFNDLVYLKFTNDAIISSLNG